MDLFLFLRFTRWCAFWVSCDVNDKQIMRSCSDLEYTYLHSETSLQTLPTKASRLRGHLSVSVVSQCISEHSIKLFTYRHGGELR